MRSQRLALAFDRHFTGGEIDGQGAALELRLVAGLGPPQHGTDAGQQLARVERLGDVVVRAQLESDDLVGVVPAGGDHDQGRVRVLADLARQREPVHARQHQIDEQDVEPLPRERLQRLPAVLGQNGLHPVLAEEFGEQRRQLAVVLDEQRFHHLEELITPAEARRNRRGHGRGAA